MNNLFTGNVCLSYHISFSVGLFVEFFVFLVFCIFPWQSRPFQQSGKIQPASTSLCFLQDCPIIQMHWWLDIINMVDDSCPSPGNFHEMVKGAVASVGTHVHSIDVILGFTKDPVPLLAPGVNAEQREVTLESPGDAGKQDYTVHSYDTVSLRDNSELPAFHGQCLTGVREVQYDVQPTVCTTGREQLGFLYQVNYSQCLVHSTQSLGHSSNSSLTWVQTLRMKQTI